MGQRESSSPILDIPSADLEKLAHLVDLAYQFADTYEDIDQL